MKTKALMVCGITSGSGKTTITQGILSILVSKGFTVKSFKLGPDYIDSGHHATITNHPCTNLDKFLLSPVRTKLSPVKILKDHFLDSSAEFDFLIIEAVGGIYDDWHNDGNNPYSIAVDLNIPILLIVDGFSYCQTMGIIINALLDNDKFKKINGIFVNKVSSKKHFSVIKSAVDKKYKKKIIGYIPLESSVFIEERHLGLHTSAETSREKTSANLIKVYTDFFSQFINLNKLISLCKVIKFNKKNSPVLNFAESKVCRIAVAKDEAFSFYYHYNLKLLEKLGAELVYFSPLHDEALPEMIDAIYLGGGFPELYAKELAKNRKLKEEIKIKIENYLPVYAECGGLMYLGKEILYNNIRSEMVGIFNYNTEISKSSPLALDYVVCKVSKGCLLGPKGTTFKGHVFHKSTISINGEIKTGIKINTLSHDKNIKEGFIYKNSYASYVHIHFANNPDVAKHIIDLSIYYKNNNMNISRDL